MSTALKKCIKISALFLGIWLSARYLLPLALPFLLGAGLALLAEPMTRFLCARARLSRSVSAGISVSAAFLFLTLLLLMLAALILRELGELAQVLPDLGQTARSGLDILSKWLLELVHRMPVGVQGILERNITGIFSGGTALLDQAVRYILGLAGNLLTHMPDGALTLGTAVIASFMISAKLPDIRSWLSRRIPRERLRAGLDALRNMRKAVAAWLFAQLKLSGVTWGILSLGFLLLRVPYAPLWAFLTALVDALPVLGTAVVLIPWSVISFLQNNAARGIGMLGIYAVVVLVRSALEPKLVGKHLGLDPLMTLFALYAGYRLFGLGGMILAPLLTVTVMQLIPQRSDEGKS